MGKSMRIVRIGEISGNFNLVFEVVDIFLFLRFSHFMTFRRKSFHIFFTYSYFYSIEKFFEEQFKKLERVTSRFGEFREVLLGVVKTSAR